MLKTCSALALALLAGCAADDDFLASETAEIGITLPHAPDGIDCIQLTLANSDGVTSTYAFSLTGSGTLKLRNVTVGAYDLSAIAFGVSPPVTNETCDRSPTGATWATETPVPIAVMRGKNTQVDLTLVRTGGLNVTPAFFEAPEVVAAGQGRNVRGLAATTNAGGTYVAWIIKSSGGANGKIMQLRDVGSGTLTQIADGQTNPSQVIIDPDTTTVYWSNLIDRRTDGNGNFLADGSMWSTSGFLVGDINPSDIGFTSAGHKLYWSDSATGTIDCYPCAAPFSFVASSAPALTAHGNRVYWSNGEEFPVILAQNEGDTASQTLRAPGNFVYGMSADDQFLYYIDFDTSAGIDDSNIMKIPAGGGAPVALVTGTLAAFPITVFKGFVYYLDGDGVHRVPTAGGPAEDVTLGTVSGFALTTSIAGKDYMYWTDPNHGGLVWRGRL